MKKQILITVFAMLFIAAPVLAEPLGKANDLTSVPVSRAFDLGDKANVYVPVSRKINADARRGFRSNASRSPLIHSPSQRIPHGSHEDLIFGTQPDVVPIANLAEW
ncbi:MAG: hypothetical protein H7Y37_08830 [Anaerolineae bacterium]|nr:hypothetical protein [Gloeobacterales cyanobacterium ES-bin-313]